MRRIHRTNGRAFRNGKPFIQLLQIYCRDLLDFVFPPVCPACDERNESTQPVCERCSRYLERSIKWFVQKKTEDFQHLRGELFFDEIVTCWEFTSPLENLIHCLKYQRGRRIGRFFGLMIASRMIDHMIMNEKTILISVPLHKIRYRERDFNQAELICRSIASVIPVVVETGILVRTRNTYSQTRLEADERMKNVKDALRVRDTESVRGRTIILVDDVVTTGSTMNSCARCLKNAGAGKVVGLALARPVLDLR